MSTDTNPFKGHSISASSPMRTLHRFAKPGGHWAEIRERRVTQFHALEFIVFVDGSLLESQMFHNGREVEYPGELAKRIAQFTDDGWQQVPVNEAEVPM